MDADEIIVIIIIAVVFIGFIYAYLRYNLTPIMRIGAIRWAKFVGSIIVGLIAVYLLLNLKNIQADSWVLIAIYVSLVGVTLVYAVGAHRQANASYEIAKEMAEQRYAESLPILVPDIITKIESKTDEIPYVTLKTGNLIKCRWNNVGKGIAISSRFSFYCEPHTQMKANYFPPNEPKAISINNGITIDYSQRSDKQSIDIQTDYQPKLVAEYQDIYERKISTIQGFRIDEKNGDKKAFLGEVYFTVNGKRLGV